MGFFDPILTFRVTNERAGFPAERDGAHETMQSGADEIVFRTLTHSPTNREKVYRSLKKKSKINSAISDLAG
jgi:hypothetical protein